MIRTIGQHWQMLRIYDVGGKLLHRIQCVYANSLSCIRVKGSGSA